MLDIEYVSHVTNIVSDLVNKSNTLGIVLTHEQMQDLLGNYYHSQLVRQQFKILCYMDHDLYVVDCHDDDSAFFILPESVLGETSKISSFEIQRLMVAVGLDPDNPNDIVTPDDEEEDIY